MNGMIFGPVLALGAAFMHRLDESTARFASLAGGLVLFAGLLTGFGTMVAMLLNNAYLGVREDGLVFHDDRGETWLSWDDVVRIECRRDAVVVAETSGREQLFYAGGSSREVAERIELLRRRASLGLAGARLRA